MISRYIPDCISSDVFMAWMDWINLSKDSRNRRPLWLIALEDCWLDSFLEVAIFLSVVARFESKVKEVGLNLSFILLDLTRVMMSSLLETPCFSRVERMTSMFSLILVLSLALLLSTYWVRMPFFIFSSAILTYRSCNFSFSFLLNSRKRSSWTVISLPDNIFAQFFYY